MKPGPSSWGNKAKKNNLYPLEIDKIMSGESQLKEEKEKPGAGQPCFRKAWNAQSQPNRPGSQDERENYSKSDQGGNDTKVFIFVF